MTAPLPELGALGDLPAEAIVEQIYGQSTVGFGLIDPDMRYLRINRALAEINGRSVEDHLGRTIAEVLPHAVDVLEPLARRALAGEALTDLQLEAPGPGGPRLFEASYLPLRGRDGQTVAVVALVLETTGRRRAETALRTSHERLMLALEGTATGTFEWDVATGEISWSPNMGEFWGRGRGWMPADLDEYRETLHPDDREGIRAAIESALETGTGYEREFRILRPDGEVRWMHSRVHVQKGPDGRPQMLVGLVGDITDRRNRELAGEYMARASVALTQSLDVRETLRQVAELAVPELADWAAVSLVGEGGEIEQIAVAHRDPAKVALVRELQERYPPDPDAPTGTPAVVRSGRPELYPEVPDELLAGAARDDDHLRLMRTLGLRSIMMVPMLARGRVVGVLSFAFAETARGYGAAELELAEELGRRAGTAVDNARLLAAEQEANRQLRQLQAIADVALTHLDFDALLDQLLERLVDITHTDMGVVLMHDPERDVLRVVAARGLEDELVDGVEVPMGRGVAGRIAATRRRLVLEDVREAHPISRHLRERARSLAGMPLIAHGQLIGVLHVATFEHRVFDPSDIRMLELVADRLAMAISHAQLYEQARSTSVTLQRSLLPRAIEPIPGLQIEVRYLPGQAGTEVGGDWYDAFPLPSGAFAIAVGDVVGRGIPAAATMGQLRAAVRAHAFQCGEPARAVQRLDEMVDALGGVSFATLSLMTLHPGTGRGWLCLAGHLPPVVRQRPGSAELVPVRAGVPIGVTPRPRTQHAISLDAGALALLYTDGLVERRDVPIDQRLARLVAAVADGPEAPAELVDHVVEAMLGDVESTDDVAVLAVRRHP